MEGGEWSRRAGSMVEGLMRWSSDRGDEEWVSQFRGSCGRAGGRARGAGSGEGGGRDGPLGCGAWGVARGGDSGAGEGGRGGGVRAEGRWREWCDEIKRKQKGA